MPSTIRARATTRACCDLGVAAWAGFPLVAPTGEVLGSFCVVDMRTRSWTEQDVHVLQTLSAAATGEVALRMALHDEREARQRADREAARSAALARSLQASLLPPELPTVPGLDVAARYLPAAGGSEVVGDFFDSSSAGRDAWGFMIGDVAGKGVEAAKLATLARHTIRTGGHAAADAARGPARRSTGRCSSRTRTAIRFVTAIYGTLELTPTASRSRSRSPDIPVPLVRRAGGRSRRPRATGPCSAPSRTRSSCEESHPARDR